MSDWLIVLTGIGCTLLGLITATAIAYLIGYFKDDSRD